MASNACAVVVLTATVAGVLLVWLVLLGLAVVAATAVGLLLAFP